MKIAYLASQETIHSSVNRRVDAFEHDLMMSVLETAFKSQKSTVQDICWDQNNVDWAAFDAVLIGTTWDYCDRYNEFLAVLNTINQTVPLHNSPNLVKWNSHKTYLRDLENKGIKIIPTHWIDKPQIKQDWPSLFKVLKTDKLVIKRQIGANAEGQSILKKGELPPTLTHPVMVQPFLDAVNNEGELSFIFIDGELSHALIKRPAPGDYRVQSCYGGTELALSPNEVDVRSARLVLNALEERPLYARVDMLREPTGALSLMELELIEPFLYPIQGPDLGIKLYKALKKRL